MESLRELYRIGRGPSSSHTMAPSYAARKVVERYPATRKLVVVLQGSLAKTGKGHLTDVAIRDTVAPIPCTVVFDTDTESLPHPNTMVFSAFDDAGTLIASHRIFSTGGGRILFENEPSCTPGQLYDLHTFTDIKALCTEANLSLAGYVRMVEGDGIFDYLHTIWDTMKACVDRGLAATGVLAGGLNIPRKAGQLLNTPGYNETEAMKACRIVSAYAFAVGEENAAAGIVATAPTCGAAGVVPGVLYYAQDHYGRTDDEIVDALAAAGVIGNIVKTNASISGAECGCQAEVGTACCMAAAAMCALLGMSIDQIDCAAEAAMEHHLGLTCDPVAGLVQIPCIERNAVAAMRAMDIAALARCLTGGQKVSFDTVVETMYETGRDLYSKYRETSEGGLARNFKRSAANAAT